MTWKGLWCRLAGHDFPPRPPAYITNGRWCLRCGKYSYGGWRTK